MSGADGRDFASVPGGGEPVVDRSPDGAAADRWLARAPVTGDQEDEPLTAGDRLLERAVDRPPGAVQGQSMQVDDTIGRHTAAGEPAVPAAVEGGARDRATSDSDRSGLTGRCGRPSRRYRCWLKFRFRFIDLRVVLVTR